MDAVRSKRGDSARKIHLLEQPTWKMTKCGTQYWPNGWDLIGPGDPVAKDLTNYCKPCWRGRKEQIPAFWLPPTPTNEDEENILRDLTEPFPAPEEPVDHDDWPWEGRDHREVFQEVWDERWKAESRISDEESKARRIAAERDAAREYANQLWRVLAVKTKGAGFYGNTFYGFDGYGDQVLSADADRLVFTAPAWIDTSYAPWKQEENRAIKAIKEAGCKCVVPNWGRMGWRPFFGRISCLSCKVSATHDAKDGF